MVYFMRTKRKHIRLRHFDYSSKGEYFVTICTYDRVCYFGKIENGMMFPSDMGKQAEIFWKEISSHFVNVVLGEYVIMPNHIHGIIEIGGRTNVGSGHGLTLRDANEEMDVGTRHGVSLQDLPQHFMYDSNCFR